ncbi:MAG TPA: LysM peptidoglycan-binding domain-containing protein [Epulopiscium sp.]|nr:LysM peptidoglycan-binding domain-containing protein [Candidatus Epulonipiscium sp.]
MKKQFNRLTTIFFAVVMLLVVVAPQQLVFAADTGKHITIIHTNDTHSRVATDEKGGSIGFEKIATLVKQAKTENPNTLVVDAGDTLHGQTFATISKGQSIVDLMNIVGYDVMVPGNHDFNYGQERLLELKETMAFPLIAANIIKADGSSLLSPYVIKEVDGIKIAIFGLSTPETAFKTSPNNVIGLTFEDPSVAAQRMVDELKDKADVIIALAHLGLDESSTYRSDIVAEKVTGIDLIIDGHSHTTLEEGKLVNGTLIAQTGDYDKNLGYVDLQIKDGKITEKKARLIKYEDAKEIESDEEVLKLFADVDTKNSKTTSVVVGNTPIDLDGTRENARMKQTNLGSVIADAMLHQTNADVAITNGGGLRASIEKGDITQGQVITVLPFGNYVKMIEVKGSTLLAAMERGVSSYPELDGGFPQVGGMTYTFNASKPANERITEILVGGKKLDESKTYKLATNDFMSIGGDNYTMFKDAPLLGEFPGLDEATIAYLTVIGDKIPSDVRGTVVAEVIVPEVIVPEVVVPEVIVPVTQEYIVKANDMLWKIAKKFGTTYEKLAQYNNLKNANRIFPGQKLLIPAN